MTGILQLTEQRSPTAQTFVVDEACVLTGVGIFFNSAHDTLPITLELRPTTEGGTPSAKRYIPGTRVMASASAVSAKAGSSFGSAREYKFEFPSPVYVPGNSLLAVVLYSSAPADAYKVFFAENGEFNFGTTTSRYNSGVNVSRGALYASSNGTTWEGDNNKDLTFKVYKAQFDTSLTATAKLEANIPPVKKLSENLTQSILGDYVYDPLIFTKDSSYVSVLHPSHGFRVGDTVKISSDTTGIDSGDTVNGILGSSILGAQTIKDVDAFGYSFDLRTDSNADSSIRAGGTGLYATEQYIVDEMALQLPFQAPTGTNLFVNGNFTSIGGLGDANTGYDALPQKFVSLDFPQVLKVPAVIASKDQENGQLSGDASTLLTVNMTTADENVAPYFNVNSSVLNIVSNFIDYQQSDDSDTTGRNYVSTVPYTAETNADGGTVASKHITVPFRLSNSSTSIVVLVDAIRPEGADFDIWYRTSLGSVGEKLEDQDWVAFGKDIKITKSNSYIDVPPSDDIYKFVEYEFNVFNLAAFDEYQIKITMNATNSTRPPMFTNLRTIATS
jgi:hypothetical protein